MATKVHTIANKSGNSIGVKKFKLISEQLNNMLLIQTPKMHTWGIQEFVDKNTNIGDGKFKLSLNFPMESNVETDMFKDKLNSFYNKIIDIIENNSTSFYGKKKSRDVILETSFPILKYSKIKESLELDYTKPPSISIKIDNKYDQPNNKYSNELDVKIYDKRGNLIYPNDNPDDVPMNYVTKSSNVVAVIKCNSIWINSSTWGITFSAVQIAVINQGDSLNTNVCQINFDNDDDDDDNNTKNISTQSNLIMDNSQKPIVTSSVNITKKTETFLDNTDNDIVLKTVNDDDDDDDDDDNDDDDDDDDKSTIIKEPVKPVVILETTKRVIKKVVRKA